MVKTQGTPPCPRYSHGAAMWKHYMIIFGGSDGKNIYSDVHLLDTSTAFSFDIGRMPTSHVWFYQTPGLGVSLRLRAGSLLVLDLAQLLLRIGSSYSVVRAQAAFSTIFTTLILVFAVILQSLYLLKPSKHVKCRSNAVVRL